MIKEYAYAKINLTLKINGKREDGYHDLESIMVPLTLCDELSFEEQDELQLESCIAIEENIILKAAKLLKERYAVSKGAKITLTKRIPIAAGLAGGSADASATLRGLNRLWNLNLKQETLADLSAELGSDTIFCIYNRPAIVSGRGEKIQFLDFKLPLFHVLLINPQFSVSTKEVFNHYHNKHSTHSKQEKVLNGLRNQDKKEIFDNLFNDLEEVTFRLNPCLNIIKKEIDVNNIYMSGSGPTLFILSEEKGYLERIQNRLGKYLCILTQISL